MRGLPPDHDAKVEALRQRAGRERIWGEFRTPDELALLIVKALREWEQNKATPEQTAAAPSLPPNLPRPPLVGFVARRDKDGNDLLERLKQELAPEKEQVVALWGPGGVGKTTLAAQAVRALAERFGPRLVWTSAEKKADYTFGTLLDEIAAGLGREDLRPLAPEPKREQVRLLCAGAPVLIALDNFETMKQEEQTRCVEWLREELRCPALLTTRQQVPSARNLRIAAMAPEEAREYLERLIRECGSPRAFEGLDRDALIRAAEANPLVMQWVVAQVGRARRPQTVLDELARGKGDAAQRVFDRSFGLMDEDAQAVLLALSLFVPDASRPALAVVSGFGEEEERLGDAVSRLFDLCLVETTPGNERLTLEGLTRQFAFARLSRDPRADEYRARYIAFFLRLAESHAQPTPEDYDALEAEKDNLLRALDEAFERQDWESVMGIAEVIRAPVGSFLSVRGYWEDAIRGGERAAEAARRAGNEWSIAMFEGDAATIRKDRGEYDTARAAYEQALDTFKRLGSEANVAVLLHQLGIIAQDQGSYGEARMLYEESLEIKRKLGNQSGIATSLGQLGNVAYLQGDLEEARRLYEESLEIFRKIGNQNGIAGSLHQLGRIAQLQGDYAEARRLYNESLEIAKKLGDQRGIALSLHQLGRIAEREGDREEATRLFREALSIFERLGSPDAATTRESLERVEGKKKK